MKNKILADRILLGYDNKSRTFQAASCGVFCEGAG